jgi:hypothetical protein
MHLLAICISGSGSAECSFPSHQSLLSNLHACGADSLAAPLHLPRSRLKPGGARGRAEWTTLRWQGALGATSHSACERTFLVCLRSLTCERAGAAASLRQAIPLARHAAGCATATWFCIRRFQDIAACGQTPALSAVRSIRQSMIRWRLVIGSSPLVSLFLQNKAPCSSLTCRKLHSEKSRRRWWRSTSRTLARGASACMNHPASCCRSA